MLQRMWRAIEAARSSWSGPLTSRSPELARLWMGAPSSAGIAIDEHTALNYAAVWSAVALISDDVASLPLKLYRRLPNGGKDRYESHRLYRLLHESPNPEMTSMVWRRTLQAHALTWGNGYSEIQRDTAGRPVAVWPITPDRVSPFRDGRGELRYRVTNLGAREAILEPDDIIHVPGLGFDGITGYSVVSKARESMGLGIAAERFGGTFFGNGSTFGGVVSYPTQPAPDVIKNNREALESRHQGVDRAHKLLALYGGAKYEQIGVPPNDAQFLETRVFQIREIARWFKVPPHKLADLADATFSNVEQQNLDYFTSCLRPWLELWEQELTRKLVPALERNIQFIEHVTEGLLRADAAGRSDYYSKLFSIGAIRLNEIRERENLDPVEGGDTTFVPLNMMPLDRLNEYVDAQIAKMQAKGERSEPVSSGQTAEDMAAAMEPRLQTVRMTVMDEIQKARDGVVEEVSKQQDLLTQTTQRIADVTAQIETSLKPEFENVRERLTLIDATVREDMAAAHEAVRKEAEARQLAETQRQEAETERLRTTEALASVRLELDAVKAEEARLRQEREALVPIEEVSRWRATAETEAERREELETSLMARASEVERLRVAVEAAEAQQRDAEAAVERAKAAALDASVQVEAKHQTAVAARRAVLVEVWGRLVRREISKAKAASATPSKLRAWMETYYDDETERGLWLEALLPAIRLQVVLSGASTDAEALTAQVIAGHFAESRGKLTTILEAGPEGFTDLVRRRLDRWAVDRADLAADAVMEGRYAA